MPHVTADDGTRLYYEETGEGAAIVFVHEFAGDHRSWEQQVRYFSRRYRCVTYNARGYPPSDVPDDVSRYSQDIATDDIAAVMRGLKIDKAHVVGLSMGGFASLHFGLRYPELARSVVVAGCGYGAPRDQRERFKSEAEVLADRFLAEGMGKIARGYASGATRVQLQNKDPRGYAEFMEQFCEHSALGSAMTLKGYQAQRPSLYDLEEQMRAMTTPCLLVTGDEDEPCLEPNIFMKRTIPTAGLVVLPKSGHGVNLEEPALFNAACQDFFTAVELGRWSRRDPRSLSASIMLSGDENA